MFGRIAIGLTLAGLAVPALALGIEKLEVFKAMNLDEGEWVTSLTVESVIVTPKEGEEMPPVGDGSIASLREQEGRSFQTSDCIGNRLSPNEDLVLPGVTVAAACSINDRSVLPNLFSITATCGKTFKSLLTFAGSKTANAIEGNVIFLNDSRTYTTEMRITAISKRVGVCKKR